MTESNYRELLDKFADQKKQKRTAESEKLKEIQQLTSKNNQLQTDFENAKVTTAGANKKVKIAAEEAGQVEEQIQAQQKILEEKTADYEQTIVDIREKETIIEEQK